MKKKTKERLGTFVMFLGLGGFFFFMQVLGIFGSVIEYKNPVYVLKSFFPFFFMFGCIYLGARLHGSESFGRNFVFQFGSLIIIGYLIGLIFHG